MSSLFLLWPISSPFAFRLPISFEHLFALAMATPDLLPFLDCKLNNKSPNVKKLCYVIVSHRACLWPELLWFDEWQGPIRVATLGASFLPALHLGWQGVLSSDFEAFPGLFIDREIPSPSSTDFLRG